MSLDWVRWAALTSVLSSVTAALVVFIVFRIGFEHAGAASVGCWALIQGLMIVARIADSGLSANVTRLVAIRRAERKSICVRNFMVAGASLATLPVMFVGAALIYPATSFIEFRYGGVIAPADTLNMTIASYVCGVLASANAVILALIEGFGKVVYRNFINLLASLAMATSALPLISEFGGPGIGLTNLTFFIAQFILGVGYLAIARNSSRESGGETIIGIIHVIWKAGLGLSLIGALRLSFEPLTKMLLSMYGSLPILASFDLALRIASNVRVLFQSAIQPLLVVGSRSSKEIADEASAALYRLSNDRAYQLSYLMVGGQLAAGPILSQIGLGRLDETFLRFFAVLAVANAINTFGIVGYYAQLSSGVIRPLIVIQFVMLLINCVCGLLGGALFGPFGVVVGYGLTFAYGGIAGLKLWLDMEREPLLRFVKQHTQINGAATAIGSLMLISVFAGLSDAVGSRIIMELSMSASALVGALTLRYIVGMWAPVASAKA